MDGSDVLRATEEIAPRISPLLGDGERLQVVLKASTRPAKAVQVVVMEAWPFFRARERYLLVATDRRWLILETAKERHAGALSERGSFPREIRVGTSWFTRFDDFDQPYSIDPVYELWAVAANDALAAAAAGRPWTLAAAAPQITAEQNDGFVGRVEGTAMRLGRLVPRRRTP